jgi:hypothetical protein
VLLVLLLLPLGAGRSPMTLATSRQAAWQPRAPNKAKERIAL